MAKKLTEYQEKAFRHFFFDDEPELVEPKSQHRNMNAISIARVFDADYGAKNVFVPPYAITVMWYLKLLGKPGGGYYDSDSWTGSFTREGLEKNRQRVVKQIEEERPKALATMNEHLQVEREKLRETTEELRRVQSELAASQPRPTRSKSAPSVKSSIKSPRLQERFMNEKEREIQSLKETMQKQQTRIKERVAYINRYKGITEEVFKPELAAFERAQANDKYLLDLFDANITKIDKIKEGFLTFLRSVDTDKRFYMFVPINLRHMTEDGRSDVIHHSNGLLLVFTPGAEKIDMIHIDPAGTQKDERSRFQASMIVLTNFLVGRNVKWIAIQEAPPQYYTKDWNCIFWTRYVMTLLFTAIRNDTKRVVPIEEIVNGTILAMTSPENMPELGDLIQQYKEGAVVRTIPHVLNVLFPPNGTPLLDRINTARYKDVYDKTEMLDAYRTAEWFGLALDGGKRTRKQRRRYRKRRTYKQ